jgi:hypothetical protein
MKIEGTEIVRLLEEAAFRMNELDGLNTVSDASVKDHSGRAETSKELLFIAHLCKKAETLILDEYHSFKGYTAHTGP